MDEPTNDLDIETLELLEELLLKYSGTLLLVSHDRSFLNNVVTSTMVLEGNGVVHEFAGGYDDWLSQRQPVAPPVRARDSRDAREKKGAGGTTRAAGKLSFKDERELAGLPARIERLEAEQVELGRFFTDSDFYRRDAAEIAKTRARLDAVDAELRQTYQRWEALEAEKRSCKA